MKSTHYDILNSLNKIGFENVINNEKVTSLTNVIKIKEIKKLYSEMCKFSLKDYSIIFCKDQYHLYETVICSIAEAYTNMIGIPHIICNSMEHPDIISILNQLEKKSHLTVTYINLDIYGGIPLINIKNNIKSNTALIIVSYINYLTGTINNIKDINALSSLHKIPLFSDCIYTYGKISITDMADIFSIDFTYSNLCLLVIKNTLLDGYKLKYHSDTLADGVEKLIKINNNDYKKTMQLLISPKFQSNTKIDLKKYLVDSLINYCKNKMGNMYWYDHIVNNMIIPKSQDIITLGYDLDHPNKSVTNTISFVVIAITSQTLKNKLEKKNINILCNTKIFENIGLLSKWSKHVITLNLDNCNKKDIDIFLENF